MSIDLNALTPAEKRKLAAQGKAKKSKELKRHELSACYPTMGDEQLKALADDIKQNGLEHPIELYEGEIIDGWNRYVACGLAKVEPWTTDETASLREGDLVAYVKSNNGFRRHLTTTDLAIAAAKLAETKYLKDGAKNSQGKRTDLKNTLPKGKKTTSGSKEPEVKSKRAIMVAAKSVGSSPASTKRAAKVLKDGAKETIKALESKEISLNVAGKIASKPKSEQPAAVKAAVNGKPKGRPPKNGPPKPSMKSMLKTCETAFGTLLRTSLKMGIDEDKFRPHFNAIIGEINRFGGKK